MSVARQNLSTLSPHMYSTRDTKLHSNVKSVLYLFILYVLCNMIWAAAMGNSFPGILLCFCKLKHELLSNHRPQGSLETYCKHISCLRCICILQAVLRSMSSLLCKHSYIYFTLEADITSIDNAIFKISIYVKQINIRSM